MAGEIFTIQVVNWPKFQHYSKRNPPWIKLHRSILTDRLFLSMPRAARSLLVEIWVLASESTDGSISMTEEDLRFRLHDPSLSLRDLKPLVVNNFIVDASGSIAACVHVAPESLSETETETETETESCGNASKLLALPETGSPVKPKAKAKPGSSRDFEEDDDGYAVNDALVVAALQHYLDLWRKRPDQYHLTPERARVIRAALREWGIDQVKRAITIFRKSPAYAFNRGEDPKSNGKKFDGLAEYVLSHRMHLNSVSRRIEEIMDHGGGIDAQT